MIVQQMLSNCREIFFRRFLQTTIKPAFQDFRNMLIDSYVKPLRCFSNNVTNAVKSKFVDDVTFFSNIAKVSRKNRSACSKSIENYSLFQLQFSLISVNSLTKTF